MWHTMVLEGESVRVVKAIGLLSSSFLVIQ